MTIDGSPVRVECQSWQTAAVDLPSEEIADTCPGFSDRVPLFDARRIITADAEPLTLAAGSLVADKLSAAHLPIGQTTAKVPHRPTVLQVVPRLSGGGAERVCTDIGRAVQQAGWRSLVVSSAPESPKAAAGFHHITAPVHRKNPWTIALNALRLARLVRRERVDIVHAHSRAPAWSAWLACRMTGAAFVCTAHAPNNHGLFGLKRSYNSIVARGDRVIAVSEFMRGYLETTFPIDGDRLRVVKPVIDLSEFDPAQVADRDIAALRRQWRLPDGVPVILVPGRISRRKGQAVMLKALAALPAEVHCVFAGTLDDSRRFLRELRVLEIELGVADRVRFVGHCENMAASYRVADIVVSPSVRPEGFGLVIVEAQAMGRPVIASDLGGARETIVHGSTGWLVPPEDPAALAAMVAELLNADTGTLHAVCAAAMAASRAAYPLADATVRILDLYREIVGKAPRTIRPVTPPAGECHNSIPLLS